MLIEKNVKILKDIDTWIISEVNKPFKTRISFCGGNFTGSSNYGTFYPQINNLVKALESREAIHQDM